MSLGCAIIHKTDANGETTEEGKRCMPYDYSGKVILSVIDYLEKMNKEITHVKTLKRGKVGHWIAASGRLEGSLYRDDKATALKGIGIKTLGQLTVGGRFNGRPREILD